MRQGIVFVSGIKAGIISENIDHSFITEEQKGAFKSIIDNRLNTLKE